MCVNFQELRDSSGGGAIDCVRKRLRASKRGLFLSDNESGRVRFWSRLSTSELRVSSEKKVAVMGDEPRVLEKKGCSDVVEEVSDDVALLDVGLNLFIELATCASTSVKLMFSISCWAL